MIPLLLSPNLIERPYRGGSRLAAFRRASPADRERVPEDWVGSTTSVFGGGDLGLSVLADGTTLRDAIRRDAEAFLGPDHVSVMGTDPGLLVKLIDAQQRLSVHLHPDRRFARQHLGVTYGKTEAWYILDATRGAAVHLGFRNPIGADELLRIVEDGQGSALLEQMNRLEVTPGDLVFVPAGTVHAIGEGIFLVEVQEPSDLLVRLEWSGYAVGAMANDLGLGFPVALTAVDRSAWGDTRLETVVRRRSDDQSSSGEDLLPADAAPFFRLGRVRGDGPRLEAGFSVLIVVKGSGELQSAAGTAYQLEKGDCWLIPWAAGPVSIVGAVEAIRCRPAEPLAAAAADPNLSARLAPAISGGAAG